MKSFLLGALGAAMIALTAAKAQEQAQTAR
jgi:hypothetical protein